MASGCCGGGVEETPRYPGRHQSDQRPSAPLGGAGVPLGYLADAGQGTQSAKIKGPLHWQKTKIKNTWLFRCTIYTARKTHNFSSFLARKVHVPKEQILIPLFLVSGAHGRLLAASDLSTS